MCTHTSAVLLLVHVFVGDNERALVHCGVLLAVCCYENSMRCRYTDIMEVYSFQRLGHQCWGRGQFGVFRTWLACIQLNSVG